VGGFGGPAEQGLLELRAILLKTQGLDCSGSSQRAAAYLNGGRS